MDDELLGIKIIKVWVFRIFTSDCFGRTQMLSPAGWNNAAGDAEFCIGGPKGWTGSNCSAVEGNLFLLGMRERADQTLTGGLIRGTAAFAPFARRFLRALYFLHQI